ncbi:MAG: S8 family serine peptidase [Candidatus Aenigmatarchaeota archaeon]
MSENTYWKTVVVIVLMILVITLSISTTQAKSDNQIVKILEKKTADSKLDNVLQDIVSSSDYIEIMIFLKDQPAFDIAQKKQTEYAKELEEKKNEIRNVLKKYDKKEKKLGSVSEEPMTQDDQTKITDIGHTIEKIRKKAIDEINAEVFTRLDQSQQGIIELINSLGGEVINKQKTHNVISAKIPANMLNDIASDSRIQKIYNNEVFHVELDTSTPAVNATTWWNADYNGSWVTVAILDTGIDNDHPALNVTDNSTARTFYEQDFSNDANVDDLHSHGTHCAGIVASSNNTYRGIAPGITSMINAKFMNVSGSGTFANAAVALDWATASVANPAEVLSNSWGGGYDSSDGESGISQYIDALVDNYDVVVVVSAGNDGLNGAYTITNPADAYNVITVGAVDNQDTITRADDAFLNESGWFASSVGPTLDGRKKPDIVAPGLYIMSASRSWETSADFVEKSGTSMAAPHVAGAAALLTEYGLTPKEVKALLINTAEDKGTTGWDPLFGWGSMDLDRAFIYKTITLINNVTENSYILYKTSNISSGERVTLVWDRHVVYDGSDFPSTAYTVNDLDLYLYNESNGSLINSSTAQYDNVEQVKSDNTYNTVVLKVHAFTPDFSHGINTEDFALASDSTPTVATGPSFNISQNISANISEISLPFNITINVSNVGDLSSHNTNLTLSLPTGLSIVNGTNPRDLGTIINGTSTEVSWNLTANRIGTFNISSYTNSSSYDLNFSNSSTVSSLRITPNITISSPDNQTYNTSSITVNITIILNASKINISLDGTNYASCSDCSNLSYSLSSVSDSSHNLTAYVTGYDGYIYNSTVLFLVDTSAPIINNITPTNGTFIYGYENETFTINYTENSVHHITLWWKNSSESTYASKNLSACPSGTDVICSTTVNLSNLTHGDTLQYYFGVFDNLSYETYSGSNTSPNTVTIDKQSPLVFLILPSNGSSSTIRNNSLNYSYVDTGSVSSCSYQLNTSANVTITSNTTFNSSDGNNNITVYCTDTAGNVGSNTSFFYVDSTSPTLSIILPQNASYNYTTDLPLNYSSADNLNLSTTWYIIDSESPIVLSGNRTFNTTEGNHTLYLYVNDSLGNQNNTFIRFNVDLTSPIFSVQSEFTNETTTLSDSVYVNITSNEILYSAIIEFNGTNTTMENNSPTTWYYNKTDLSDGNYTFRIFAIDFAINTNISSPVWVYINTTRNMSDYFNNLNATINVSNVTYTLTNTTGIEVSSLETVKSFMSYTLGLSTNSVTAYVANFTINDMNISDYINATGSLVNETNISSAVNQSGGILDSYIWIDMNNVLTYDRYNASIAFPRFYGIVYYLNGTKDSPNLTRVESTCYDNMSNKPCFRTENSNTILYLSTFSGGAVGNDTTNPTVTIQSPTATTYSSSDVSLSYSSSDNVVVDSCWYVLNSGSNTSLTNCSNTTITAASGSNILTVYANDTTGNIGQSSVTFSYTAPSSPPGGGGGGGGSPPQLVNDTNQTNVTDDVTPTISTQTSSGLPIVTIDISENQSETNVEEIVSQHDTDFSYMIILVIVVIVIVSLVFYRYFLR